MNLSPPPPHYIITITRKQTVRSRRSRRSRARLGRCSRSTAGVTEEPQEPQEGGAGGGAAEEQQRSREQGAGSEHHGADPLAGSAGRHPAVLLLHPVPLQSAGHARAPDLRRQLEVPHLHRPGDPGGVFRRVCAHRRLQSADEGQRQRRAGAAAEEADWPEGLDDGRAGLPCRSVRGVHLLEPVPVRQGAGLPKAAGQLHPSVAQPRHAHHRSAVHHHRDADHPPSVSQQVLGSGRRVLLRRGLHPLDLLGAPCDRRVGLPGAGADLAAGSSRLLQRVDRHHLCFLHTRRNPQQLHLGPAAHSKGQR